MTDFNQDEIDKLLQDALVGGDDGAAVPEDPDPDKTTVAPMPKLEGAASQDDIDALFAAMDVGAIGAAPAEPAPQPETPLAAAKIEGPASQDDIDALFAAVGNEEANLSESSGDTDLDALFSAVDAAGAATELSQPAAAPAGENPVDNNAAVNDQEDMGAFFESQLAEAEAAADMESSREDSDFDALLSSIAGEEAATEPDIAAATALDLDELTRKGGTTVVEDIDMDELLRQVAEAAPPPPPPPQARDTITEEATDTAILTPDNSSAMNESDDAGSDEELPPAPPPSQPAPAMPPPAAAASPEQRREFSVLYGAGEVESVANQINALLTAMSEKAHGYMQAWIAADAEAKELRSRALAEERRRTSLESEKNAVITQLDELRVRLGELEGAKIASEESRRTLETTYQARIRELESRVSLLATESETLKDELTRARNQATGVDIESRRARFEADRLKGEVESERMERLRIQRALENREKEIQALQSQSSGQASSLFIDELHRLVRRLESELDARASGAHEALKQLDRLDVSADMVPVTANLRAALMQAIGQDADADDALKALGREAAGVKGPAAIAPAKTDMVSFESALATYNLKGAVDVAGTLLREASATPGSLMRKIYLAPALRRPELADHLGDLARLMEGLRTVQESNDRTRGSETGESEVFYVHMFDYLHNLVRLKLINRMSGDIWRLFLDLRGRFSFVSSDKQWAEYRDKTLQA